MERSDCARVLVAQVMFGSEESNQTLYRPFSGNHFFHKGTLSHDSRYTLNFVSSDSILLNNSFKDYWLLYINRNLY
jgi:hypothetical protein